MSDKLDRLVATRVMGWTVRESDPDDNDYERYTNGWAVSRWNPSTSIAAAWEVQVAMKAKGYKIHFEDFGNRYLANFAGACYEWRGNREHSNECMAICLAALAAVNVPEATIQEACK